MAGRWRQVEFTVAAVVAYPDDADNSTHLLQKADAAMYMAKTEGRDAWRRYVRRPHGPSRS